MHFIKILIFFIASLLVGCGDSNTPQSYIESGKTLYEQKDYDKAQLEFKNALQLDDQQADAFYYLALIYLNEKKWDSARMQLLLALQVNPKHVNSHLQLATLFFINKDYEEALKRINTLLAFDENNLEAQIIRGSILLKQNKVDEALIISETILSKNPGNFNATSLKVGIYLEQEKYAESLEIIENSLKANPTEILLNLRKLDILNKMGDNEAIKKYYVTLIDRFPTNFEFSFKLGKYYIQHKEDNKAFAIFENVVNKNPEHIEPKLAFIEFLTIKKPQLVEQTIKDYLLQMPKEAKFYFKLARFYFAQKQPEKAKTQLNLLIKNTEDKGAVLNAKIKLAALETDVTLASALIEEVLAENNQHLTGLLLKSVLKLKDGLYDEAIADLLDILKNNPNSDDAMVLLAQAYLKRSSPELANDYFRKALETNPGNKMAIIPVLSALKKKGELVRAENILIGYLSKNEDSPQILLELADIRLRQGDWKGTQEVAKFMNTKSEGIYYSKYVEAKILQGQKKYKQAADTYKEVLIKFPNLSDALKSMLLCYEALKQRPLMHSYLVEYIKLHPENPYAIALQVHLFAKDKNFDSIFSTLTKANNKWPKIPEFYEDLAKYFRTKKEPEKMMATYRRGMKNLPQETSFVVNLATVYYNNHKYKEAVKVYDDFLIISPKNERVTNNLASLLVDYFPTKANLARALVLTQDIKNLENVYALDTYAWVLFKNNRDKEALEILTEVIAKERKIAVFRYHLAKINYKMNNLSGAISQLEKALLIGEKTNNFAEKEQAIAFMKELKNTTN
ncbi:MAG: tetratricopeptide repeat protein [Methylococcales bacterium]|nr:tetratricopeptide repeat protein [Methylococcales bacterium]